MGILGAVWCKLAPGCKAEEGPAPPHVHHGRECILKYWFMLKDSRGSHLKKSTLLFVDPVEVDVRLTILTYDSLSGAFGVFGPEHLDIPNGVCVWLSSSK